MSDASARQLGGKPSLIGMRKAGDSQSFVPTILRSILLDLPIFMVLSLYASTVWINYVHDQYLAPQLDAAFFDRERKEKDSTYYARTCDARDITTRNGADLFLPTDATAEEAYQHQLKHGFSIFKSVLSPVTASNLRNYAVMRNRNLTITESIYVIENEYRYSFGLGTEEPSVAAAVKELTNHNQLSKAVEKILGPDPALLEMTTITVAHGAADQWWHGDVYQTASPVRYARTFTPAYSIFVQLQNTTREMGATGVCPGSHYCGSGDVSRLCESQGFQVVDEHGYWASGDALLMNMNSWHRGSGHVDPKGEDRVMLILTIVPKPKKVAESRQMSQGITFSLRWDMWGHTWGDMQKADTAMTQPWAYLRALGLYKPSSASWGIDYITGASMRISNKDAGYDEKAMKALMENGGISFLPNFLQGEVDYNDDSLWHNFIFSTLLNIERLLRFLLFVSVLGYMIASAIFDRAKGSFFGSFRRLGKIIGLVYLLFSLARFHVDNTQWAKDITASRRYTSVFDNDAYVSSSPFSTLPNRHDVLIQNRCDSDDLHLYNDFVGGHPGNRRLLELVDGAAPTYTSYP